MGEDPTSSDQSRMSTHFKSPSKTSKRWITNSLIILALLVPTSLFINPIPLAHATTDNSWNPNVKCQAAVVTTDHGVIGDHFNATTKGALESGGPYGVFVTQQSQIGSTSDLQPDLNPPCTYPNVNGTMAPTFVEIHGISLTGGSIVEDGSFGGKCGTHYQGINGFGSYPGGRTYCTAYGVFQDTSVYTGNCEALDNPNPKICMRLEIDRDWVAAGYCGAGTVFCDNSAFDHLTASQKIDVQGFVAWHPPSSAGHGYSSWELHPMTAWRFTPTTLTPDFSWTPSQLVPGQVVMFSGSASGGRTPYTFKWNFGDGTTVTGSPAGHAFSAQGSYSVSITVTDSNSNSATVPKTIVIAPTLSTGFTYAPASPGAGISVTFTATASGGFSPYGFAWAFGDGGTATGGSPTHTYSATGTYTVTLTTSDSASHSAVFSNNVMINPRATTTAVNCTMPVVVGQGSSCTATVTDASSGARTTPTGNVTFVSDSPGIFSTSNCNLATVSSGVAGCNVSYRPSASGNHLITGSYGGDSVHSTSSGASTIVVGLRATTTTLSCVATGFGFDEACTATVSDTSPETVTTPVGTVSFTTNSTGSFTSNSCSLSNTATSGVASCQVTYTPAAVATHTITGSYSGDVIHLASQGSASIGFGKDTTATALSCAPSSVMIGQATICTVTVTDTAPVGATAPTGSASFSSNGAGSFAGSPCALVGQNSTSSSCQATYMPTSGAGTHSLSATYGGDGTHDVSTSSQAFALTVILRSTSTSVSCSPSSVVVNRATSCTATVVDFSVSGGTTPTGNVLFVPGGSCVLASGSCSVSITPSASGSLSVSASYGGDSSHSPSSGSATVNVGNRATSTSVSCSPSPATNNTVTSCVATVSDTDVGGRMSPSGSVSFASNSTGVFGSSSCSLTGSGTVGVSTCAVNYTPVMTGFHTITANYAGDPSHAGSSGSVVTVIGAAPQPAYALVVSIDGKVGRLYQNGTLTQVPSPVTTPLRSVAWKPDGSYALISGDFAVLMRYNGTGLTIVSTPVASGYNFWTVSWKPDGSYALIGGSAGTLLKYDGVKATVIPNSFTTIYSISWNPSGSTALLVGKGGLAMTFDGTTIHPLTTGVTVDLLTSAWNPNGAYALIGGLSGTLLQFNGTQISPVNTSVVPAGNAIRAISFNPTGTLALLAGDNWTVHNLNGA